MDDDSSKTLTISTTSDKPRNSAVVQLKEKKKISSESRNSLEFQCVSQRSLEKRVIYQARELNALRQVLERLRGAVIHCDAQNIQMQVTLQKQRRLKENRDSRLFDKSISTVEELECVRELLICTLAKVKDLEKKVDNANLKEDSGFSQNENSAPTDVNSEKDTLSDVAVNGKCDSPNYKNQMDLMKKRWSEIEQEWEEERLSLLDELNVIQTECKVQETELKFLEDERVRLATQEEKLKEALRLLGKLKLLNFPRRTLGKILLDSLVGSRDQNIPENHVHNFLDLFYQNLLSCELHHNNSLVPLALQIDTEQQS